MEGALSRQPQKGDVPGSGGGSGRLKRLLPIPKVKGLLEYMNETEAMPPNYAEQPSKITDFIYVPITVERVRHPTPSRPQSA